MKKSLRTTLALLIVASLIMALPITATAETFGNFTYTLTNGKVRITGTTSSIGSSVTIPETILGHPVTAIGSGAFEDCDAMSFLTIPDSIITIEKDAFRDCDNLGSVTIPNSVTSVGESAFYHCDSLSSVTIPDTVTSIGKSAFRYCPQLRSVTLGNGLTSIKDYAFANCTRLSSITIPDNVLSIGPYAFSLCSNLKSITIPNSVTAIEYYAFSFCSSLTDVHYLGTEDEWTQIVISTNNNAPLFNATIHTLPIEIPAPDFTVSTAQRSKSYVDPNAFFYQIYVTAVEDTEFISLNVSYAPEGKKPVTASLDLRGMSDAKLKIASTLIGIPESHYDTPVNGIFTLIYTVNNETKTITIERTSTFNQSEP